MVREHQAEHESQWATICSIAEKIGCTAETLRKWCTASGRLAIERRACEWLPWRGFLVNWIASRFA
jgi:hypothetical protein